MLMLLVFAGTAMADLTQHYYKNRNFWQNAKNYPEALNGVIDAATVRGEGTQTIKKDGATVQLASNPVTVTADGSVVVKFIHDGGDHMLNILGVDLVDAEGNVVANDYHYGSAGGTLYLNEYTLEGLTANASLTLRSFVYDNTATNDRTNSAAGRYEVTNVTGEEIVTVNAAVNLANGVYVIRDVRSLDLPFYNGSLVERGSKIGDIADAAYTFTITKGSNGYYTIQVANGDYVVYTSTNGGGNVAVKAAADANDGNKWWAIREGKNSNAQRIIVPMTNDKYNAPGWNFSAGLNGQANKALGLWETTDDGSQWYIGKAPYLAEGTMKLKIANTYAYSNGTNIVKATENNSPLFTFKKGENGCYTIQDVNGKFLTYESTNNHLLKLSAEANDDNKWWIVTSDLQGRDGMLEILPKQDNFSIGTHAFNWSQGVNNVANAGLGFWGASDGNSYCEMEMIPTEGLYCIKAAGTGNDVSWYISYKNNEDLFAASLAAGERVGAKHIWNFEAVEDGFKLKSCNLGKYATLENASSNGGSASKFEKKFESATKFVFYPQGGDKFIIKDGNGNVVRTENGGAVNYWSGEVNETWQLVRVDHIEVSVNEFASICLPFAVEVEGATAYAVENTATKGYVVLAEKADIAANEGAILAGNAVATLNIIDEATADWSANKLEGTTVDSYIAGDAYVLASGANGIGLYGAKLNKNEAGEEGTTHFKNNANKSYLPRSTASGAAYYSFRFGEGTTGISEVKGENGNVKAIYDLTGRRIEAITAPGIYIVNGKKVLVN